MKKIILLLAILISVSTLSFAKENYKLNDEVIDQLFAQSESLTATTPISFASPAPMGDWSKKLSGGQTKGGYLVRAYFLGCIGMHRTYMGTGGKTIWYYYCIPWYGDFLVLGDFWLVLFKKGLWEKYENNPKICVWLKPFEETGIDDEK